MKIYDIFLIIILLIFSFVPFVFYRETTAETVVISIDNKPYKAVDLSEDTSFQIKTRYGENTVEIKNNGAAVTFADCKDHICMKTGAIKNSGEVIACLPHKLLIEIR